MAESLKNLAKRLRDFFDQQKISYTDFSQAADITRANLNKILDEKTSPTLYTIDKIANALGQNSWDLLKPENEPIVKSHTLEDCLNVVSNAARGKIAEKVIPPKLLARLASLNESQRKELFDMIDHQIDAVLTLDDEDQESGSETG